MTRESIQPTYDSRETGERFSVEYFVNDRAIDRTVIADPFVRGTVTVSWRDLVWSILRRKRLVVTFRVDSDNQIIEDVMELDANYKGAYNSSRRLKFDSDLNTALHDFSYVCPE